MVFCVALIAVFLSAMKPGPLPDAQVDARAASLMDPNRFEARIPEVRNLEKWQERREEVREIVLNSTGLWPPPPKHPLNARIFDEKEGDGFRVAKVHFESLPGYLATGNLYRPASGSGPFPAILSPHGHWRYGRLTNEERGSVPGRSIDLARLGFVVLAIDMVGYNDSLQLPHDPFKSRAQLKADLPLPYEPRLFRADFDFPRAELYGLNLSGLQLWNCIRGVDFLTSLPEVDAGRIGAAGASGGATQTLMLMAVDDRIQAAAPVNIIGATRHPGCRCENPPGLWRDTTTIEVSATFAPRPLLLASATEDPWTYDFPERELPIFQRYYALYEAEENVKNVHVDAGHNFNAETRAAVYEWFARHLNSPGPPIPDPAPVAPEPRDLGDLRVFPDQHLPESALPGLRVIENWIAQSEKDFEASLPSSRTELDEFAASFGRRLSQVLGVEEKPSVTVHRRTEENTGDLRREIFLIGRRGRQEAFRVEVLSASRSERGSLLLVHDHALGGLLKPNGIPEDHVRDLLSQGYRVVRIGGYASGELSIPRREWEALSWPHAYNRDDRLNAIQDTATGLAFARRTWQEDPLTLVGLGRRGLLVAFAGAVSGEADRVIVDLDGRDPGIDAELLELLPVGALKRIGDFRTAVLLLARKPLELVNPGPGFESAWYEERVSAVGLTPNLRFAEVKSIWPPDRLLE